MSWKFGVAFLIAFVVAAGLIIAGPYDGGPELTRAGVIGLAIAIGFLVSAQGGRNG